MDEHAAVVDVSRYRPADGKREEMLAEMKKIAERATRSEGCFGAQVCTSSSDSGAFVAVSRWKSRQALEKFSGEVATRASQERLTDLLGGRAQHEHLTPV